MAENDDEQKAMKWPWIALAIIVLLVGGYFLAAKISTERVPSGTSVAGVQIGGMKPNRAASELEKGLAPRLTAPVQVTVQGQEPQTVNPADYKLALDTKATLKGLTGFTLNPVRVWNGFFGRPRSVDPVLTQDDAALAATVAKLNSASANPPADASITFDGATAVVHPSKAGVGVDEKAADTALTAGVAAGTSPITLATAPHEATITTDAANKVKEQVADPLVSANIDVDVKGNKTSLTPAQLAAAASFAPVDGELKLKLDPAKLADEVRGLVPSVLKAPVDARIEIKDHTTPTIIPSADGEGVDGAALAADISKVGTSTVAADRKVTAKVAPQKAAFTKEDAEKLGVKEVVAEISTPLTNNPVRTTNLRVGTANVSGTLVKPGETFSLLNALGPIDEQHGFVSSGVIENGFDSEALGGGLSQLSTNTFNVGYLSGMVDVEHKPHSKYFDRYPMGRESTLWAGTYDMKWKNRTPYGAVIDTWLENGHVVTKLWSTKYYDVTTSTSKPYNFHQPTTVVQSGPGCKPQPPEDPGFTVKVSRVVKLKGEVVEDSSYNWTYQPVNGRICR